MTAILYLLLFAFAALPAVIFLISSETPPRPQSPRAWLIGACIFTVALLTVFSFYRDRLEPARLPGKNPLLWYTLWAVLMVVHWYTWFAVIKKGKNPFSTALSLVTPCLLLLSVGLGQGNLPLAGSMLVYAVIALFQKGADMI